MFDVESFKAKLIGGGSRPNLFRVLLPDIGDFAVPVSSLVSANQFGYIQTLTGEATGPNDALIGSFLAKAASLPASKVNAIPMKFRGREIKIVGDREFDTWDVTFINDNNFSIRSAFENWMHSTINTHKSNIGSSNPARYKKNVYVEQFNKEGEPIKIYKFFGSFPNNVQEISLSYESTNAVEEFTVTFSYDYWTDVTPERSSTP